MVTHTYNLTVQEKCEESHKFQANLDIKTLFQKHTPKQTNKKTKTISFKAKWETEQNKKTLASAFSAGCHGVGAMWLEQGA